MATQDYWAFLIQREGDRSWLPLGTLETEILEGNYRIIARSQRCNVDVEIRLEHVSNRQPLPQRWSQKRMAKTNEKGFLLVLPFTAMQPGKWSVVCSGDIMSDLRGDTWRHALKLQVLPTTIDADSGSPKLAPPNDRMADAPSPQQNRGNEPIDRRVVPPTIDPDFADLTALLTSAPVSLGSTVPNIPNPLERSSIKDAMVADGAMPAADTVSELRSETGDTEPRREPAGPLESALSTENVDDLSVVDPLFAPENEPRSAYSLDDLSLRDTYIELDDASDLSGVGQAAAIRSTDADAQVFSAEATDASSRAHSGIDSEPLPPFDLPADVSWGIDIRVGATAAMADAVEPSTSVDPSTLVEPNIPIEPNIPVEPIAAASPSAVSALIDAADVLPPPIDRACLTIELVPSIYHFRRGEVLMVYGQVMSERMPTVIAQAELMVKLIDPQTASPIAVYRQTLDQQSLPLTIAAPLGVPDTVTVQLLVGEVVIDDGGATPLVQQTFTATAAVDELIAAIGSVDPVTTTAPPPQPTRPAVDFGFFNFIGDAPVDAPAPPRHRIESMQDVDLPGSSPPELQSVDRDTAVSQELVSQEPGRDPAAVVPISDPPRPEDWSCDDAAVGRSVDAAVEADRVIESELFAGASGADAATPGLDDVIVPELDAALPVHDHAPLAAAMDTSDFSALDVALHPLDPAMSEVVVDDVPEILPLPRSAALSQPVRLSADEPLPKPMLAILEEGDLVIGQAVHLQVKLPPLASQLYVKLWISDRQTRTLLDGPRWMVDFVLNDHGELEATTQLTLPFGSLEVQIAAISVEAATQRESYRVVLNRVVISPSLDDAMFELSLDEF